MRLLIRDLRGDEEGVASTVGTIMALLVFLTFLSLIVNQYVPVWMKDSEASHMNNALGQFGGLNGAIIRYQSDGQTVRAQPTFVVVKTNNTLDVSFGLVSLYGTGIVSGTSTEVVNTQVFAFDRQDYTGFPSNTAVWVNHTSPYGLAWYSFLNSTLANALKGTGYGGTFTQTLLGEPTFTATYLGTTIYIISARYNTATQIYTMRLQLWNRAVLPLTTFRLQPAQVQVGIGDTTQNVQF